MSSLDYDDDDPTSIVSTSTFLLSLALGYLAITIVDSYLSKTPLPDVPWVGSVKGRWFFRGLRTRFWCWWNYEEALKRGYEEYGRHLKPCVLATLEGEVVLLPSSNTAWLTSQPETTLSATSARKSILQTRYTSPRPEIVDGPVHVDTVKSKLMEQTDGLISEVCDELREAVDSTWGFGRHGPWTAEDEDEDDELDSDGWRTILLHRSLTEILAKVNNRLFVGLPLCRNDEYIKNVIAYSDDVPFSAAVIRSFSGAARLLMSRVATYNNHRYVKTLTNTLTSEINQRQSIQKYSPSQHSTEEKQQNDLLQSFLTQPSSQPHSSAKKQTPINLSAQILHLNLQAIPPTSFVATNALLDILASPKADHVLDTIRKEAIDALGDRDDFSSDAEVQKLAHLDSALRESSRRAGMLGVSVLRTVVQKGGVTTPDGLHLPQGCMVGTHVWGIQHDGEIYPEADKYRPFRFLESSTKESFSTTSDTFLAFSHGEHSCPGRDLASTQIKLLIAYLLTRYEVQIIMEGGLGGFWNGKGFRPECEWLVIGSRLCPPTGARVKVRRREGW